MTPHKYDHILIYRNPFREYSKPPKQIVYKEPDFIQLRIYYKCESAYFKSKTV